MVAALRETTEEIGLDAGQVELLGRLPDYQTGTGFNITPVVGLVAPPSNCGWTNSRWPRPSRYHPGSSWIAGISVCTALSSRGSGGSISPYPMVGTISGGDRRHARNLAALPERRGGWGFIGGLTW